MHTTDLKKLPRVDLRLTALGLGCSQMGGLYRATSAREVEAVFASAWAAGVRYFDTAPYYGYTRSEHRLGAQLADCPRHEYVVSTKVGRLLRPDTSIAPGDGGWANPYPFRPYYDYSYSGVMRSFEDSLQRLGLAHIDILYVHDIGRDTHGDAHQHYWQQLTQGGGFRALDELRRSGSTRAVGLGVNEWQVVMDSMQEFFEDIGDAHREVGVLSQLSNISRMIRSGEKEIARFEKQVKRLEKKGIDASSITALIAEGRAKLAELKALSKNTSAEPEDFFAIMEELDEIRQRATDEFNALQDRGASQEGAAALLQPVQL